LNRQAVVDWWRLSSYRPTADISQLAAETTMAGRGRDLFFASHPAIEEGAPFDHDCNNTGEQTIVLGCYRAQNIYIYNVLDTHLSGVKEVTAAHEMLHAAYERLGSTEKQHVNALLVPQIKRITDERLLGLIKLYNQSEPGELYNEMHSILGTEVSDLSPELETYYSQYFTDRKKIVAYSDGYEGVFAASKQRLAAMDSQLDGLRAQITADNSSLDQQSVALNAESMQLNNLRSAGQLDEYNQAVPAYNQKVRNFNSLVDQTKKLVAQYNALVEARNKEAAAQNNLYQSLDSRYQAVQQN
jgi:chromosome segregation ATPase